MFELGHTVQTRGIFDATEDSPAFGAEIQKAFLAYINGDWGDTCEEDKEQNEQAIKDGNRILAVYNTSRGKIYIITEWDRSVTTVLFDHEY